MGIGLVAKVKFVDGDALAFACIANALGYTVTIERDDPTTLTLTRDVNLVIAPAVALADAVNPFDCYDLALPEPDEPEQVTQIIVPVADDETAPLTIEIKKAS